MTPTPLLRQLGRCDYLRTWEAMRAFTDARGPETADEFWLVEHPPVFTLGLNAKPEHLLAPGEIPVVATDRGGQVTYHGPGQALLYPLVDLRRLRLGVREWVSVLEGAVLGLLAGYGIEARARADAPGVYVPRTGGEAKVASVGLRVRHGCSYHGIALNVAMDLSPFARINPCGHPGMPITQLSELGIALSATEAGRRLAQQAAERLGLETLLEAPALMGSNAAAERTV